MRELLNKWLLVGLAAPTLMFLGGCGSSTEAMNAPDNGGGPTRLTTNDTEVRPGRATRTVFDLYYDNAGVTRAWQTDTNTNQAYCDLGYRLARLPVTMYYDPTGEPASVATDADDAIARSAGTWSGAVNGTKLIAARRVKQALAPVLDGYNSITWRTATEMGADPYIVAQAVLWVSSGTIVEAEVVLNKNLAWSVNEPIKPGESRLGEWWTMDVQSVITREMGHVLGLGSVSNDQVAENGDETDATMYPVLWPSSLVMQTLTPGDIAGAKVVTAAR